MSPTVRSRLQHCADDHDGDADSNALQSSQPFSDDGCGHRAEEASNCVKSEVSRGLRQLLLHLPS